MTPDPATKRWIRNAADERAAARGMRFSEARGQHVIDFAAKYLKLYEGECAGQPLVARDWQIEVTMRLFGWERYSERWGRWVRRFTQAGVWVPKKNKKSPTLAWWALYLLVADGEPGQKVYFAAKDGSQAREIAGKHAVEMCQASPELMAECSINKGTMQITHEPSRSILKPLSSGDSRTQKAKEGLNGSVLVDECHVVDREFMNRISRTGISRSEPLLIEASTAGNDPESYGRSRYEYGKLVEKGDVEDDGFLFACYEAPQDLGEAELAADPVRYGKMANPAWGHTVGEEEFLADYHRSKLSLTTLADFLMYRLNVWQQSTQPWLRMGDWKKCERSYAEADLLGRECYGGLDLAKTRDTCALALVFPEEDGSYKQIAYFWAPRARAEALRDKVPLLQWAREGHLVLTDGDTTDYGFIRQVLIDVKEKFDLRKLAYDDHYATELLQRLSEEDGFYGGDELAPFGQTITNFAGPTDAYEALVIEGKLAHNGNKLLSWQAGNCTVKTDVNHNKRPVKQKHGDHRTIDGVVAGIMALSLALARSAYAGGAESW